MGSRISLPALMSLKGVSLWLTVVPLVVTGCLRKSRLPSVLVPERAIVISVSFLLCALGNCLKYGCIFLCDCQVAFEQPWASGANHFIWDLIQYSYDRTQVDLAWRLRLLPTSFPYSGSSGVSTCLPDIMMSSRSYRSKHFIQFRQQLQSTDCILCYDKGHKDSPA